MFWSDFTTQPHINLYSRFHFLLKHLFPFIFGLFNQLQNESLLSVLISECFQIKCYFLKGTLECFIIRMIFVSAGNQTSPDFVTSSRPLKHLTTCLQSCIYTFAVYSYHAWNAPPPSQNNEKPPRTEKERAREWVMSAALNNKGKSFHWSTCAVETCIIHTGNGIGAQTC